MNAAITAARLGAPAAFAGRVSSDQYGQEIWAHIEASGVDMTLTQRGDEPTARAIVETEPVQRFTFEGEGTADASMDAVDVTRLGVGPHVLHGGTLGIFRGQTADVLAQLVADVAVMEGSIISFDPNIRPAIIEQVGRETWWRYADQWLAAADLVRGSDEDFEWMGVSAPDLLARGVRAVIETRGAQGAAVHLADGSSTSVDAEPIDFVDAVGAGDSFCGAVLSRIHADGWPERLADWQAVLAFAVRVAGITCSRPGADPPWARELV